METDEVVCKETLAKILAEHDVCHKRHADIDETHDASMKDFLPDYINCICVSPNLILPIQQTSSIQSNHPVPNTPKHPFQLIPTLGHPLQTTCPVGHPGAPPQLCLVP